VILYEDGKVIIAGKPHEVLNPEAMPECEFPLFFSYMLNRGFF
jgi:ABC-type hemin transport system ATPase subunit